MPNATGEWTFYPETGFLSLRGWSGDELPPPPTPSGIYGISLEDCVAESAASVENAPPFRELRLTNCRFARSLIAARQRRLTFIVVSASLASLDLASTPSLHSLTIAGDHIRCEGPAGLSRLASLTVTRATGDPLALLTGGGADVSLDVTDSEVRDEGGAPVRLERARFRDVAGITGAWARRMRGLQSVTLGGRCDGAIEALKHAPDLIRLRVPGDTPPDAVESFAKDRPEVRLYRGLRSPEPYGSRPGMR